jgi:uncharacterized damage-inducible protein DinB
MEIILLEIYERLKKLHEEAAAALADLPQEGLDWSPGAGMNSLCVLAVHIVGSERFWIGDGITMHASGRDRESEFRSREVPVEVLKERLDSSLDFIKGVLEGLTIQDLSAVRPSPRDGQPLTVGYCLAMVLAHTAAHVGHMQVTRQIWDISH